MTKYFVRVDAPNNKLEFVLVDYETFKIDVLDKENHVVPFSDKCFIFSLISRKSQHVLGFEIKE